MAKISLGDLSGRLNKDVAQKLDRATKVSLLEWSNAMMPEIKREIVEIIKRGQSPVQGGRGQTGESARFVRYSPSYSRSIQDGRYSSLGKKLRPVNLTLTGRMLQSIKSRLLFNGFSVWFTSPIAKYHTVEGAGRSKVKRKMLPVEDGDTFTRLINKNLADKFKAILSNNLKKG